mmetsp:Transcript_33955/g.72517  ORF Transcript_33955/g.72517 Transcript_33955/m.72517 type:complete len:431 (-) Transcript_33955:49-1341(-)|eukprot:CAMPEP_0183360208 /NCGR_PEP_ID=MMETSP0164_2-20130417/54612_1 /TAXON_ID=221442 /ORGANISM="Coccolithus pelagicus ssp braarudi, Strain PLY182g" /LENGTH=430 /DNA_ID=CAMNT_0025534511 /DNA_START=114 /DNA_END=1406 /DNA_ORIENTATION=+
MSTEVKKAKVATSKLISQGHDSFELIFMMLMGIRTAVGKFASASAAHVGPQEFNQKWEGDFIRKGTAETPAHSHADFKFKDYAPLVFRQLRERFGITAQDYMLSLTSEYVLVEMFTNSKSGSFFFYSADYRFVLKTCTKREAAFLMAALPQYHAHLMQHRFTLLCRFFGLHRVHHRSGKRVYFAVMGNVFPIDKPIHERYDLKGSTRNRFTTDAERQDPNVVLKDLDFINARRKLQLGEDKKRRLLTQIKKDCELLERLEVIDYSMLIGIHRSAASTTTRRAPRPASMFYKLAAGGEGEAGGGGASGDAGGGFAGGLWEAEHQRGAAVKIVDTVSQEELHDQISRRGRQADEESESELADDSGSEATELYKEVYYVGVIDILCEYGLKKQLEHHYKAAKHGEKVGAQNFSVVDPLQYSSRFQNFVADGLA